MAKRKITKLEITKAVTERAGNVTAIARALECTPQTVYNTLDAYGMRGDLEAARLRKDLRMKRLERIIEHVAIILTNSDNARAVHKRRPSPMHDKLALKRLSEFFCESSDIGSDIRQIIAVIAEDQSSDAGRR